MSRHVGVFLAVALSSAFGQSGEKRIEAPRFWNDHDLSDWATPVAGLNVRPGNYSEKEYYSAPPGELVRTYPVYFPGREPAGYWDMLQNAKPEPLIHARCPRDGGLGERGQARFPRDRHSLPENLRSQVCRSPSRRRRSIEPLGGHPQEDGTVRGLRWVPTAKGLALSLQDCASCHSRVMSGWKHARRRSPH